MKLTATDNWDHVEHSLTEHSLRALIADDIAVIHIENYLSTEECQRVAGACQTVAQTAGWQARTSPMQLIGGNFSNAIHLDPPDYFKTVQAHEIARDQIFDKSINVLGQVTQSLQRVWPHTVEIAKEDKGRYFAGGFKLRTEPSPPHFDFVPYFTEQYALGQIKEQLSWNVYFTMPKDSGHTDIFATKVVSADTPLCGPHANRVPPSMLGDVSYVSVRPKVGDMVLFATRHPHRVVMDNVPKESVRIQIGSFLGLTTDDRLVMWS